MTPERWHAVEFLFHAARAKHVSERAAFLEHACASDPVLRQEVESLLAADRDASGFLESPSRAREREQSASMGDDAEYGAGGRIDGTDDEPGMMARLTMGLAGRYAVTGVIGRGGMATVFLAQDLRHERPVALKVLRPELARALGRDRFQREIRMAARLQHPHILAVHDSGESAGYLWFTMPYVDGETLRNRLTREIQLPIADALRIASQAAGALAYAHDHGVIHRDVKPANLLLTTDGITLVADFGIARALRDDGDLERLTERGLVVGTPAYMSPEQVNGERVLDARTDVYSLGCVLYEMLAGEPPFTGPTVQVMIAKRMSGDVPSVRRARSAVPVALDELLSRTLAPIPSHRLATAAAVVAALGAVSRDTAAANMPASPPKQRSALRRAALAAAILVAVAALAMGVRSIRARTQSSAPMTSRPLTFAGAAEQPALSPNGRQMAYVQTECKAGEGLPCAVTLRVQDIGSEQSVALTSATWVVWPQWSPDGAWILVRLMEHEHLGTYLVPRYGGEPREIGPFGFTSFSTNGDTIVLVEHALRNGNAVVRRVRSSTGEILDSARIRLPLSTLTNFAASPDGRWLAFAGHSRRGAEIVLARPDGRIADSIAVAPLETVRWSRSGDALYTFSGGVGLNNWLLRLRVEERQGHFAKSVDTLLSLPTLGGGEFDLAPDGRSLVYAGGPVTTTIWAFDMAVKPALLRRLVASTSRIRQPSLSSDGQLIAYAATDQAGDNIYVLPFEGGNAQRITHDSAGYGGTQWFPSGHRLLFMQSAPRLEAFAEELPQGARRLVARVEGGQGILPLPDGGMVVQAAGLHLILLDAIGTHVSEIVLPDSLGDDVSLWSADADGTSIYMRAIPLTPYRPRLYRVNRASGALTLMDQLPIAKTPQPLKARGSVIYATWEPGAAHHPTIWRLPPGGPAVKVRELPFDCDPWTLSMALDEQRFVCSASVSTTDIFLVEHIDTFHR